MELVRLIARHVKKGVSIILPDVYSSLYGVSSCQTGIGWRGASDSIVTLGSMVFDSMVLGPVVFRFVLFRPVRFWFMVRMWMIRVVGAGWTARCHKKGVPMILPDVYSPMYSVGSSGTSICWRRGCDR